MDKDKERGERLKYMLTMPAWQDVLDIMENRCKIAEDFLLNYQGTDSEVIRHAHRSTIAKRDFFHLVQQDIDGFIRIFEDKENEH